MELIRSIDIRYLRSIHRLKIGSLADLTIFSGSNDVGKSNILKALNLFFNNDVGWLQPIDFHVDFSKRRLFEVRRESIKGRQFIRIDVQFIRPSNYAKSLPERFTVTKTWYRDSPVPQETNNLENLFDKGKVPSTLEIAKRMLSQFLNRIKYDYVPAIREQAYFVHVLDNLQESLIATQMQPTDPILNSVRDLNLRLDERAGTLAEDFHRATSIRADVSLPEDPVALFSALSVNTPWRKQSEKHPDEDTGISLGLRGDGIQARYIPSLLKYISDNSSFFHIWGFEEPENSVEYNLAIDLADDFQNVYSSSAQIFVTTHSPAFMALSSKNSISYRVFKEKDTTRITPLRASFDDQALFELSRDIGLFRIQDELHKKYLEARDEFQTLHSRVKTLETELAQSSKPVVYVEGKTDRHILETAWVKLFPGDQIPFEVRSCDPLDATTGNETAAGAATLTKLLSVIRVDYPHIGIGVYDRDTEGFKQYHDKLPQYFKPHATLLCKVSKNQKAAAIILPVPQHRIKNGEYLNLEIEHFFEDPYLESRTEEGYGLTFRQPTLTTRADMPGSPVLSEKESTLPHTRIIENGGKTVFAERIVPSFEPRAFSSFTCLFEAIIEIIDELT